jgi:hypothetical protein
MGLVVLAVAILAAPAAGYQLYYGNLHAHTSYSDGMGTPARAFAYARDVAGIDVQAITDHDDMLTPAEWLDTRLQARLATRSGEFLALAGFEWTVRDVHHMTALGTDTFTTWHVHGLPGTFYAWLDSQPNALGQFSHPDSDDFSAFAYSPVGDRRVRLFEISGASQVDCYHIPLDSGWHVGAGTNQDDHDTLWGSHDRRTGIWAEGLTPESVFAALRAGRTFATFDRDLSLVLQANGAWMGSVIANGAIEFLVRVRDPVRTDRIRQIDIISNGGRPVMTRVFGDTNYAEWSPSYSTGPEERRYFYARVVENDGDIAVSSPIWTASAAIEAMPDSDPTDKLRVAPNPFRAEVSLAGSQAGFAVFDCSGSVVRRFESASVVWDGRDQDGRPVAPGVYLVKCGPAVVRLVRLTE